MKEHKRRVLNSKLAQHHGWYYRSGGWYLDQPNDCEEWIPEMLEGPKSIDCWAIEELLLRHGWAFSFADGLFIAVRQSDGFRIRRYSRKETIAIAYIATNVQGPMRQRLHAQNPRWPLELDHQCWLGTTE